ncbi:hypothetical protein [Methylobacterium gnaphalii]|uniref:Uncharacterized protein n=1 Tax=Methylobacterium gnaphalii TaxID=1010610 RepID=A0A512JF58_9HYPH|nr:hypothetical protein [Methylobacterium gnaphalii]GEP08573.1 hypothetical protein MGN01_04180 [Methylobacterium gnaphalii]GJD70591.1 hypothetical protein MMMDOFMJ_3540 [Methylobacterium gnaphalii]GLS50790.1 hypothetical protein GCM10007885_36440 [Methylobacterium gnaphalii]
MSASAVRAISRAPRRLQYNKTDAAIARMVAGQTEPHPDAELLVLGERFAAAEAAYRAACRHASELHSVCPEPPAEIFVADGDHALKIEGYSIERPDGRRMYIVEDANAEWRGLRREHWCWQRRPATPADRLPAGGHTVEERVPWPEAQARADEIVSAYDRWKGECALAEKTSGLAEAEEACSRAAQDLSDVEFAIERATARTLDGILVKARFAKRDIDSEFEVDRLLYKGLIRDILALGGLI